MLKFNLMEDEELRGVVNSFISSLLPHVNFDASEFSTVLETIQRYVHLDEFRMEHRLLLNALVELNRIRMSIESFEPRLTREVFEHILEASILDIITRPDLGVVEWLEYEGMKSDLSIPTIKEEVCQKVCGRAIELYDECYAMEESTKTILNHEPELRAAFVGHVGTQCINVQVEIMRHHSFVGKRKYQGFEDWMRYTKQMTAEIDSRLSTSEGSNELQLDSVEGSYNLLKELSELMIPIANYGIPELDDRTPILRHRLVVVVGMENIGKTQFAVDKAVNVILSGGKVVYMCGESVKATVYAAIMRNYVYKRFGIIILDEHLAAPETCPDEIRKIIGMSIAEVVEGGKVVLCDSFGYATLKEELGALYDRTHFDMVVIDHSCALTGTIGDGTLNTKVSKLATDCRDFKKEKPVCVMVTSHPSATAKETAKSDKMAKDSTTKGSQNLSTEADEVFLLRDNETLAKQGLLILENAKRRSAGRVLEPIILQKRFEVSALVYDASLQASDSKLSLERQSALAELDEKLNDADDFYSLE